MKILPLKFVSPVVEGKYKNIKETNLKCFFKLFLCLLIVTAILGIIQYIRNGSLDGFLFAFACLVVCLMALKYGYKFERYTDYVLACVCLGLYLYVIIRGGQVIASISIYPSVAVFYLINGGYLCGIFERLVILELTRLELKVVFATASFIARMIMWTPSDAGSYANIILFWALSVSSDIRKEINDRALFTAFYDFREEIVKFKNLMVSGLPTNILIISKDRKEKLFVNEYFQSTFRIDSSDREWSLREWLALHQIEKDSLHIDSSQADLGENLNLEDVLQILDEKGHLVNQGQRVSFNTKVLIPENDQKNIFEVKVLPLIWDSKDAMVIIMNDVTQQYLNLGLKVADANKDKMIAMISHELKNPLNGILGMLHIMEKRIEDSEVLRYLTVCKSNGKLLLNLVNSILDLGQIRSNKLRLNISKGNLSELLQEMHLLFDFQFQQKGLSLTFKIDNDIPEYIISDLGRLRQVLINLLSNSLKFTFAGGVSLFVRKDKNKEGYLFFKIADTGIGIKEEEKKKLFKMYGRSESVPKINADGVGLGLTLSDHLVKLLACGKEDDAGIQVKSLFGKGTKFFFSINTDLEEGLAMIGDNSNNGREREENSIGEEGHTDIYRRVSTHILQSQKILDGVKSGSPIEMVEREEVPLNRATSLLDNEEENLIRKDKAAKGEILLVDDNPFNIMVAKHIIEGLGYQVQTALNGKIAVDMVIKASSGGKPFQLVFMDCQMPVMDGFEATSLIRTLISEGKIQNLFIVALSANDSEDDKKRCKEVGMDDHLGKPVSEARIKGVLDRYCV